LFDLVHLFVPAPSFFDEKRGEEGNTKADSQRKKGKVQLRNRVISTTACPAVLLIKK
jgi:hypothetical protein